MKAWMLCSEPIRFENFKSAIERVNHKVFLQGQDVKCNTKFMRCYSGVLCCKIYWCKHGYNLTVSGTVSTFSYLGATHLLTLKHCLSQFVLHVMAKVLNKKPRNKRNRCTVRRTLFTWTWLTQTPTHLNKMQFPLGLIPVLQSFTIS